MSLKTKTKMNIFILSLIVVVLILIISYIAITYPYNNQLNISMYDKVYVYKFKEGTGFIENKASHSQKKAIWNLIEKMNPSEKIKRDGYTPAGGFYAFYFKKNNIKTVFSLEKLDDNKLYITVSKFDKESKYINSYFYMSKMDIAEKIKNVIILQ